MRVTIRHSCELLQSLVCGSRASPSPGDLGTTFMLPTVMAVPLSGLCKIGDVIFSRLNRRTGVMELCLV